MNERQLCLAMTQNVFDFPLQVSDLKDSKARKPSLRADYIMTYICHYIVCAQARKGQIRDTYIACVNIHTKYIMVG